jgi:hypothetical protein
MAWRKVRWSGTHQTILRMIMRKRAFRTRVRRPSRILDEFVERVGVSRGVNYRPGIIIDAPAFANLLRLGSCGTTARQEATAWQASWERNCSTPKAFGVVFALLADFSTSQLLNIFSQLLAFSVSAFPLNFSTFMSVFQPGMFPASSSVALETGLNIA